MTISIDRGFADMLVTDNCMELMVDSDIDPSTLVNVQEPISFTYGM